MDALIMMIRMMMMMKQTSEIGREVTTEAKESSWNGRIVVSHRTEYVVVQVCQCGNCFISSENGKRQAGASVESVNPASCSSTSLHASEKEHGGNENNAGK